MNEEQQQQNAGQQGTIDVRAMFEAFAPEIIVRGVGVVRRADGSIKVDPGFDVSSLPESLRHEIANQEKQQ